MFILIFEEYNHFEIILVDDFDKDNPPPALALCTACPFDPPPVSQFKQDYLRFWPTGEGWLNCFIAIVLLKASY